MLREMLAVLHMDSQFDREKVGLELARCGVDHESDIAVEILDQITALKKKQQFLREETTQKLRTDIEQMMAEEDRHMLKTGTFKGDEQGITREMLPGIKVMQRAPRPKKKHLIMFEWIDLYRSQPWLAKQEAEEQRNQMDRDAQQREIEKNETILARQNDDLTLTEHARAKTRADIEALTAELKDEENPMTGDQRYSHRMTIQEKENLLKEGKEDLDRRRTQVEKRQAAVDKLKEKLAAEEEEARDRLAKQFEAKQAFERTEARLEKVRMEKINEELVVIAGQIEEVRHDLDFVQEDRSKEHMGKCMAADYALKLL